MSFQQGLSGLNATSKSLEVIGNNIANANTYGAKSSRAEFADMYANALNGAGGNSIGIGVNLANVAQQFNQGNISATENPMDLAINGNGFFMLTDGTSPMVFSRNGQFKVDKEGFIVNNDGLQLQGIRNDGTRGALTIPTAGVNPSATDRIAMEFNLNSASEITLPADDPMIDFDNKATYNNTTPMTVYDAKGQAVALTYYFQKTDNDTWNVYLTANGQVMGDGTEDAPEPITELTFSDSGATVSPTSIPLDLTDIGGDGEVVIEDITGVTLDFTGTTQFGSSFVVTNLSQNGYAPGKITGLVVEENGDVTARYSNGQTQVTGQVLLARFPNPQGLQPRGGNGWVETYACGERIVGSPGDGNLGVLQSGALEESNVDLTGELVNMITAQRNYQANAQTIKTMDQVMQTLVNLR